VTLFLLALTGLACFLWGATAALWFTSPPAEDRRRIDDLARRDRR
jgi:hypothetical protein